jgi:UDP-N-acetylmuramate dehydrogenase
MQVQHGVAFSTLTTLRVGGPAQELVEVDDREELVDAVTSAGEAGCLVIGGGSNLVVDDDGTPGRVVAVRSKGVTVDVAEDRVSVVVAAGETWDAFVERCVVEGWSGVEALSGIPGSLGATPVQNVGAYGQEVSDVIVRVEVLDRATSTVSSLSRADCGFGYRTSIFKHEPDRFVVLEVEFGLSRMGLSAPVRYAELASRLGIQLGQRAPVAQVRDAVLGLRRAKGMVLDDTDRDTWSVGSFFTNPVLAATDVPEGAPRWSMPAEGGASTLAAKVSAAWLIEQAGFTKGFGAGVGTGRARLSTKHTLAVTNAGGASTADVLLLARTVRDGVRGTFGVTLVAEPRLVGVVL